MRDSHTATRVWASPFLRWLATTPGRIAFVILRTDDSPPVALHPASRRRSYLRLQAGERLPGRDFHPSDRVHFQAHRGPSEALAAAEGGAHIADVEYPASALGTPYPLNIRAVRKHLDDAGFKDMPISTNIGEEQPVRSTACQAALGVAVAGADYIKFGLAGFNLKSASYLGRNVVRSVREWFPQCKVYPAVFPEEEFSACLDPLTEGAKLAQDIECDGLLIDTFDKNIGKDLLDYYSLEQIAELAAALHAIGKEAWIAGSVVKDQLPNLWGTDVDVICVRGAACRSVCDAVRFGSIDGGLVSELAQMLPIARQVHQ